MLHRVKSMPVHSKRNSAEWELTKPEKRVVPMVHFCSQVVSHSIWWVRIFSPTDGLAGSVVKISHKKQYICG